jgi:PGF-pre-PGF domain-containing protein
MTDRKIIAFIFIILLFFTPLASANNDNIIFLKVGHIDTDLKTDTTIIEPDRVAVEINSEAADSSEKYYLVQFDGIVQPEWKDAAESAGSMILDYVPDNTFVLKMNETVRLQVESLEFVHWVGEYLPEYKYVEETAISTNSLDSKSTEAIDLVVYLFEPDKDGYVKSEIESLDGIIVDEYTDMLWIQLGEDRVGELTQISSVSWIEESQELTVSVNVASEILNVNTVHNTLSLRGSGQIVAVSDTGLDTGVNDGSMHDDIQGRILRLFDYSGDGAEDTTGHGTHVTGSVLGSGSLSAGEYAGMAPEAGLVFQAIGYDNRTLMKLNSALYDVFEDAYNAGAKIHTNSWGSDTDGVYEGYSKLLDEFTWEHPDMLILFSAGNEGEDGNKDGVVDLDSMNSPATAKNCMAVGASETERGDTFTTNSYTTWNSFDSTAFPTNPIKDDYLGDDSEGIAAFSSRGPTNDGRIKPDIVAPGTFIASTRYSGGWYDWGAVNSYYAYNSGTSMATPLVAGSAVLVREYYNDIENVANPSAALLKATLLNGAYDLTPGQYGEEGEEVTGRPDYSQGWGRLDVENSIMADYPNVVVYYDGEVLSTTESWNHTYDYVEGGESLRATLVWTDYPASTSSSKALVNDLDLTITGSSDTYYGNGGSDPDRINNVEGIELSSVSDGDYTFNVSAHNVPHGPQPFALVASFTCDNNEYPAPDTQADSKNTAVSTDVVHPQGVDPGSVVMTINDLSVSFDSVPVTDGYNIEYNNPSSYQTGEYNVSVTATTENGLEFSYSWNFTVDAEASNNAPVLSLIENQEITETYPLTIELSAEDDDGDTLTFGTNASFGVLNDDTFTWTPGFDDEGIYYVKFNVTDDIDVDSETITITVTNLDRAPELESIGNKTVNENSSLSFTLSGTDEDGDDVTYSANGLPENAILDTGSGDFNWTPQYNESGIYNVEFVAWANGLNDSEVINITVLNVDRAPELADIGNKEIDENESLTFTISATDSDEEETTITYSANNIPEGAILDSDTGIFSWTPFYNQSGVHNIEFVATSNDLNDAQTIAIKVNNVDRAPVFDTIAGQTVNENSTLTFNVSAIDPDEDDITYSASNLPGNSSLDYDSGEFTWVTGYNDSGDYNVNFSAVSNGLTDYENVSIHVLNVNVPPVFLSVSPRTVQVSNNLQFTLNATDVDNDNLTYSADSLPDGAGFNTTDLLFNWTPLVNQTGIHYANFTVNDSQYYDYLNVSITVINSSSGQVTTSSAAGGGGGGGGGGGTSGEEYENIALKDVSSVFVGTGDVKFDFYRDGNDIQYVSYESLKNSGTISVTIEVLLDRSAFVNSLPAGEIYRNINIWVGKVGYATEDNIADPVIGFRVDRNWVEDNNIDLDSIALNRYDGGWSRLSTEQTDSDDSYLYFESSTPGFSPFAITGESRVSETSLNSADTQFSTVDEELESNITAETSDLENTLNGFSGLISCLILTFVCFLYRKQ